MTQPKLSRMTAYVPPEVHVAIRVRAAREGKTMGQIITEAFFMKEAERYAKFTEEKTP